MHIHLYALDCSGNCDDDGKDKGERGVVGDEGSAGVELPEYERPTFSSSSELESNLLKRNAIGSLSTNTSCSHSSIVASLTTCNGLEKM